VSPAGTRRSAGRPPAGQRRTVGGISLSEGAGVRYLHFGSIWVQGAMRIARPFSLELEYQRQMMAVALLLPRPRRIVQLGLGAAALTKFCWRNLRMARTTVVELDAAVVETARHWFKLPPSDARLSVVLDDAKDYVVDPSRRGTADWLQVDLYDAAARGPVYDDAAFYKACRRLLARPGVAVFNLFGSQAEPSLAAIRDAFDDRLLVLPEADAGNRIAFALTGPPLDLFARRRHAAVLESRWQLPASRWLDQFLAENGISPGERV
jgi:spermidine synthase